MSNVLAKEKRQQVLALGRLGWSLRRIERATGVRRETVSSYLKAAGVVVRGRGRPPARTAKPAISSEVSTDSSTAPSASTDTGDAAPVSRDRPSRAPRVSACESYRELIVEAVGRGRNAMAIWQDLVDDHGFPAGYASVRRFVSTLREQPAVEARVVITTARGEEAQVDYGEGPMVRDPASGKYRRTRLFVLTLGYSRKAVRLLVHRSSAQVWAELHERAFRRLGGTVRVVVLDNLKEGVLTPDIYDPALNPLYRDVLAHYGVVALPCRVGDPDRKGKVEAAVGHAQKTPLRGLRFGTSPTARRIWTAGSGAGPIPACTARPSARSPPCSPRSVRRSARCRSSRFATGSTAAAPCISTAASRSRRPTTCAARLDRVDVQWNDAHVRLLDPGTGQLLREHLRAPRGWHRIEDRDRSARTPPKTLALLAAAKRTGPAISTICDHIHRHDGAAGVRRILGVLALARKHGPAVVEEAATAALELGVPTYRFLRRYLDRRPVAVALRQVDPLIRQLTLYRDLIDRRTGDPSNLVELDQALRKLRLSGMADVLETRLQQAQVEQMAPIDRSPRSALTNSSGARTACSPGDTSRPASATPTARSTASTSPSTRRSTARSSSSSPPPASSPSAKTRSCSGRPVRARAISPRPSAAPRSSRAIASSTARRTPSSKSSPRRRSPRPARTIWPS